MKVLVIHGSPRKGNTYHAAGRLLDAMGREGPLELREVFLPQDLPHFCAGCMACFSKGEEACPHAQWTLPLRDAMEEADALVVTSPVYALRESGAMKAFLDHFAYQFIVHRPHPSMFAKRAVVLCTTAGGGTRAACGAVKTSLVYWGVNRVGAVRLALHAGTWQEMPPGRRGRFERKLDRSGQRLYRAVASGRRRLAYPILYLMYAFARGMHRHGWFQTPGDSADRRYWRETGLIERRPF